ncbi:NYN domain-containing protein [Anaeromicropila populeti]|uniref:Predicted RNA-binding protein containing a PIN domain n=1 Tax=Anaeromicropila populeti TaxID=37658 RepID=A0A1I6HJM0_9FIRM|nr:NYN domain-containing protein [Anaeromicropila populeti]SFR54672.1 Predicted RNA-binding protein containing a PIN domain [Anaeromicropila populeti]
MLKEYLLVDGYNIIFSWPELHELAMENMEAARYTLADRLCNFQGFKKNEVILVFDGHKSKGNIGSILHYNNIDIVFTKEAETADQFIEMVTQQIGNKYSIRVATSDATEQIIILGRGATRLSARELKNELEMSEEAIRQTYLEKCAKKRNGLFDSVSPEMAAMLEKMRLKED